MSSIVASVSSMSISTLVPTHPLLGNLTFFLEQNVEHLMHTIPFPPSGSYALYRIAGTENIFACTKILFDKNKFKPTFSINYFKINADGQIHDITLDGEIGKRRWPNLAAVCEWAGPLNITEQILDVNIKTLQILSRPSCMSECIDIAKKSLATAPAGVFFIQHNPKMPLIGFTIHVQTDHGIQSHPLWIALDGTLKISGNERSETFSSFNQVADKLHLNQELTSWEHEQDWEQEQESKATAKTFIA